MAMMLDRDRQIVLLVGRFSQLTSGHVKDLLFNELASATPAYRALERLTERKYLARIERRMVGGTGAGSGQYVYQLGSEGWKIARREGRYWPYRAVNYHTLAIADAYVSLKQLERTGSIRIEGFLTEPDTWQEVAGAKLLPDMHVEVGLPAKRQSVTLWLETDLGTERPKQIKDKLDRYWHAYLNWNSDKDATMPGILFLVPDAARKRELEWTIARNDEVSEGDHKKELFRVMLASDFPNAVFM